MCMRYAMVDVLRKPHAELAEVVRHHFKLRKSIVEDVCRGWVDNAKASKTAHQAELTTVLEELTKL